MDSRQPGKLTHWYQSQACYTHIACAVTYLTFRMSYPCTHLQWISFSSPVSSGHGDISSRLFEFEDSLEGLGIRSTLYRYQRRSVAAMLQRELDNRDVPDHSSSTHDYGQKEVFSATGDYGNSTRTSNGGPCRGGILCEELGTYWTFIFVKYQLIIIIRYWEDPDNPNLDSCH